MTRISKSRYEEVKKEVQDLWDVYVRGRNIYHNNCRKKHLLNKMLVVFVTSILESVHLKPVNLNNKSIGELTKSEKYFLALHALRNSIIHNGGKLKFRQEDRLIELAYKEVCKDLPDLQVRLNEQVNLDTDRVLQPLYRETLKYLESRKKSGPHLE